MLSDESLRYDHSQDVLTPGMTDSYVQCAKSSMGASLFEEENREERNEILMFSQQCLTQILESIQSDLKQYLCFLDLGCLPNTAFLWHNLDDSKGSVFGAHPCTPTVLIQHLRSSWIRLCQTVSPNCGVFVHAEWGYASEICWMMHQNEIGLWTKDFPDDSEQPTVSFCLFR